MSQRCTVIMHIKYKNEEAEEEEEELSNHQSSELTTVRVPFGEVEIQLTTCNPPSESNSLVHITSTL